MSEVPQGWRARTDTPRLAPQGLSHAPQWQGMRIRLAACLAVALAAALVPTAEAVFPIPTQEYRETRAFVDITAPSQENLTILSGSLTAAAAPAVGPFAYFNATGFAIAGLTKVCWLGTLPDCVSGQGLRLEGSAGSSLAVQFPRPAQAGVSSTHSLGTFIDPNQELDFAGYRVRLRDSLAVVHVGGQATLTGLPAMPETAAHDLSQDNAAGLVLLDPLTTVTLQGGPAPRTLRGENLALTFQGAPSVAPFAVEATLLPFASTSTSHWVQSPTADAERGTDLVRFSRLVSDVQSGLGGSGGQDPGFQTPDLGLQQMLGAILSGALLSAGDLASPEALGNFTGLLKGVTLLRFDALDATAQGGEVELVGQGPLYLQKGRVVGAPGLAGLMPWWAWLLWLAAIGAWIARLVLKPAKENERWDRLRWVGWAAGSVVGLFVFWLWDGVVHAVWGLSFLRGGGGSTGLIFLVIVEGLIGLVIYVAVVMPMSSLLKSGARFAGQGRFMGLHRPVAMLLGYVLGAVLLLSYIDLILGAFA